MHERYSEGILTGYDWMPPEAPTVHYQPDELIVRRAVDWADVPPMIAALGAVEADELSSTFLRTFFGNSAVPSGIVKVNSTWDEPKKDAFREAWSKRFGPLTTSPGIPAIFDSDIDSYERIGVGLSEMDNQNVKVFLETRICMCFGISPLIIYSTAGLLRAIESNLQEAWESTWDATALPLLREWAEWITWAILTRFESRDDVLLGNVRCRFDPSGIGPYQEDVDAKITLYREGYEAGTVKLNEVRLVMGLPALPAAEGDVFKSERQVEQPALLELPARQEVQE
jgi:Phage portal protein